MSRKRKGSSDYSRTVMRNERPNQGVQAGRIDSLIVHNDSSSNYQLETRLLKDYLFRLHTSCNALAFGDPLSGRPGQPMELAEVFTMLQVQDGQKVIEELSNHDSCVLLGEPGGGKSTVLSFLTLTLIEIHPIFSEATKIRNTSQLGQFWRTEHDVDPPIAVRVRLKEISQDLWDGVPELHAEQLKEEDKVVLVNILSQRLSAGCDKFSALVKQLKAKLQQLHLQIHKEQQKLATVRDITSTLSTQIYEKGELIRRGGLSRELSNTILEELQVLEDKIQSATNTANAIEAQVEKNILSLE